MSPAYLTTLMYGEYVQSGPFCKPLYPDPVQIHCDTNPQKPVNKPINPEG